MEELEIYELINSCETISALISAIEKLGEDGEGYIKGRAKIFDAKLMAVAAKMFYNDLVLANTLTRRYGIRQQAIYLKYYKRDSESVKTN